MTLLPLGCGTREACSRGLPDQVYTRCGCYPPERHVEVALAQTSLPELAVQKLHECVNASAQASAPGHPSALSADVKACIDKDMTLDVRVRDELVRIVDKSMVTSPSDAALEKDWSSCSKRNTQ
jgi:hypothetical protein